MPATNPDDPVHKERRLLDRRSDEAGGEIDGTNRRNDLDRRALAFGVVFTTARSLAEVEDWLDRCCTGKWNLFLIEMDEDLVKKTARIEFELDGDKAKFIEAFSAR